MLKENLNEMENVQVRLDSRTNKVFTVPANTWLTDKSKIIIQWSKEGIQRVQLGTRDRITTFSYFPNYI